MLNHRKPSTNIEVRITKIIVQIPIEQASIRTVIPITAHEQTRTHENCTAQPFNSKTYVIGGISPTTPLRAIRKPSTNNEVRKTENVVQIPTEQTSNRTAVPKTANEHRSITSSLVIIISKIQSTTCLHCNWEIGRAHV